MYNRYIPQADGTHRRQPSYEPSAAPPHPDGTTGSTAPYSSAATGLGIGNFLRQILPSSFDVGDLIVVLLLLLMAADGKEDQNTALLTMALYLFL